MSTCSTILIDSDRCPLLAVQRWEKERSDEEVWANWGSGSKTKKQHLSRLSSSPKSFPKR